MAGRTIMPIMGTNLMSEIPWALIAPHEAQAKANHGQSLNTLASRGGLSPAEAMQILDGVRWRTYLDSEQTTLCLINRVRQWRATNGRT